MTLSDSDLAILVPLIFYIIVIAILIILNTIANKYNGTEFQEAVLRMLGIKR